MKTNKLCKIRKTSKILCAMLAGSIAAPSLAGFGLPECLRWSNITNKYTEFKNDPKKFCSENKGTAVGLGALAVTTVATIGAGAYKLFANTKNALSKTINSIPKTMQAIIPVKSATLSEKLQGISKTVKQAVAPSIFARLGTMASSHPILTTCGVVGITALVLALIYVPKKDKRNFDVPTNNGIIVDDEMEENVVNLEKDEQELQKTIENLKKEKQELQKTIEDLKKEKQKEEDEKKKKEKEKENTSLLY